MKKTLLLLMIIILYFDLNAQWVKTHGPSGGMADRIVNIEDTLFVSAPYDGIFRSKDSGESWEFVNSGLPNDDIESIFSADGFIYASIEDHGIYISEDIGENWISINNGIENKTFYRVHAKNSEIYASNSQGGVYYSSNNGQTWADKSNGLSDDVIYSFEIFDSKVFAGGDSLYFSTDNGNSWGAIEIDGLTSKIMSIVSTDTVMFLKNSSNIYVSIDSSKTWMKANINTGAAFGKMYEKNDTVFVTAGNGKVYLSIDNWTTWEMKQNSLTNIVQDILVNSGSYFMTSWDGIYKSDDKGNTWNYCNFGFAKLRITSLAEKDNFIFAGTDGKNVFRADKDDENWIGKNVGLNDLNSNYVKNIIVLGDEILLATLSGLYKSVDDGDTWTYVNNPGSSRINIMVSDKEKLAAYILDKGVYISANTGSVWTLSSTMNLDLSYTYNCMEMKGDSLVLGTSSGNILISKNGGATWTDTKISNESMSIFDIDIYNDTLFVSTSKNLYYSIDLGESWNTFDNGLTSTYVNCFYEANNKYLVSTTYGEIFIYSKNSKKWYPYTDNFDDLVTNFMYQDGILYVGTDRSSVWKRESINIPPKIMGASSSLLTSKETAFEIQVSDLIIDDPDNTYPNDFLITVYNGDNYTFNNTVITPNIDFAGNLSVPITVNDGLVNSIKYNLDIGVDVSAGIEKNEVSEFKVFPNPTNCYFNISFSDEFSGDILIKLIDIEGEVVLQETSTKSNRVFEKKMDIVDLASGIYFIEIKQPNKTYSVKKIFKK